MKYPTIVLISLLFNVSLIAQWTQVTPPPAPFRTDHSFAFAINGTGYIVTGDTPVDYSASFYSYSPDIDEWTKLSDFPGGTRGYGIGDVWDNKAYFGFGTGMSPDSNTNTQKNDLWAFDPTTGEWTELAACPCNARLHPAFVAHQGNIYVGLGNASGLGNFDDWWQYHIDSDTWTQKADFPSHKRHHPYQFAIGDYVYAGFGHGSIDPGIYKTWYRYDPSNDTWLQVADLPGEGRVAGTQFSHNGYGYVLSGEGENHGSMDTGEFWRYDAAANNWTELPPHPGASRWAPASFILDNEVYLINGTAFGQYEDPSYKYNLADSTSGIINHLDEAIELDIYPNPFSDQITITLKLDGWNNAGDIQIKVFDVLGQLVHESSLESKSANQVLGHLKSGSYVLEFFAGHSKLATRTVIKK